MNNLNKLLESAVLNTETKTAIMEAWDAKLTEAREAIAHDLREEFGSRYEHDKALMVEAADKLIKESLIEEFKEMAEDKKAIKESRIAIEKTKAGLAESAKKLVVESLTKELSEFKSERKAVNESLKRLHSFVTEALVEELNEFALDRKALAEERVKFNDSKKKAINEAKARFVETAAKVSEKVIKESLTAEIRQLRGDLMESKKNMFGQKLFEAFSAEFMNSHYNEGSQVKKLSSILEQTKAELTALSESVKEKDQLILESKKEVAKQRQLNERADIMNKLLSPLNKNQRKVMTNLLENTSNAKLEDNFKRFFPMILNEDSSIKGNILVEQASSPVGIDGNKTPVDDSVVDFAELKKLSGIR